MKNLESMSSGKFALSKEEQVSINGGVKILITYDEKGCKNDLCVDWS